MLSRKNSLESGSLPALIFGERHSALMQGFHGLVDRFSHLTPDCDYDTKSRSGLYYKGNVIDVNGVVVNQTYYSHMLAVSSVKEHNILIPLAGVHNGIWRGSRLKAARDQAFFIPANDRFQFETEVDEIAGSLIVKYDLNRLNAVIRAMTGDEHCVVREENVRNLPLTYGSLDFKKLFIGLFSQIDGFDGNLELLKLNGFDDQFYRLLSMALRPDYFLSKDIADNKSCRSIHKSEVMAVFERYVEEHIDQAIVLSELEAIIGVTARALQYACMRRHGCSPRVYIRNRKLEAAYDRLYRAGGTIKLSDLAFELGFSSHSQFSKFFRERFGLLPSQV